MSSRIGEHLSGLCVRRVAPFATDGAVVDGTPSKIVSTAKGQIRHDRAARGSTYPRADPFSSRARARCGIRHNLALSFVQARAINRGDLNLRGDGFG